MFNWLHHLLNPHCDHCLAEHDKEQFCKSCDILKMELAIVREQNKQLLDTILDFTKPKVEETPVREVNSFVPQVRTWKQKQRLLEEEDRVRAKVIAEMEKELDISTGKTYTKSNNGEAGNNIEGNIERTGS